MKRRKVKHYEKPRTGIVCRPRILHVVLLDEFNKFIADFIDIVERHFDFNDHIFLIINNSSQCPVKTQNNVHFFQIATASFSKKIFIYFKLSQLMYRADKIILHGLFDSYLHYAFLIQPWLLNKCYWAIWGGDLYVHDSEVKDWRWHKNEAFRRIAIRHVGHLITYIEGDVDYARKWYKASGKYHECILYPSNVYKEYKVPQKEHSTINIQVGNSADPHNNHLEIFNKLAPYKDENIKVYVPLSYGDQSYACKVILAGVELFGDKFVPLTEFIPFDKYLVFLGQIDIAVFNHKRQQAMGNTITLLGLGKTVYMREDVTSFEFFSRLGVVVYDVNKFSIGRLSKDCAESNRKLINNYFSKGNLVQQWGDIFSESGG